MHPTVLETNSRFECKKQELIDLIIWYRDEYHHKDWCHSDLIAQINAAACPEALELIYKTVDGWLD